MSDTVKTVLVDGGSPVALSDEETRFVYNLLPVGTFYDKRYGEVYISEDEIQQMVDNFGEFPAYEVPVKIGHGDGAKSPGKVIGVEAKPEGLEITMIVDAETAEAINKKQYRYMSAEFDENYSDKATGNKVGAVLLGAALVNQPAHPYVAPLVLVDDIDGRKDDDMTELEDVRQQLSDMKAQKELAEANLKAEQEKANKEAEETAKKLADMEAQNKALIEERNRMEAEKNEAEVKTFCEAWTAKGVPPVVLEKVKPLLLSAQSRTIKLSDDTKDDMPTQKFFGELFELMPKITLRQTGANNAGSGNEPSDTEKAIKLGEEIAKYAM